MISFPYLEAVILLMLFPYVNQTKAAKKSFLKGAIFGGFIIVLITFLCIIVLGSDFTARNMYPTFALAKQINIANFFQRIEAIVAGMWFISIYFKLTICFYAASLGLAQILNLKEYRPLTMPLGMIVLILSIIITPNMAEFQSYISKYSFPSNLTIGLFLPLLLVSADLLRKKRNDKVAEKTE